MADRMGQQLGKYRLIKLLGRGGSSEVYLGEHLYLKSLAAIKVLGAQFGKDDESNFLVEAQMVARLAHPHIIHILDFDVQEGIPFLIMEYAVNGTLRQRHPKGAVLSLPVIIQYVKQIAEALQYAHEQKFVHRDIKPENLLLGRHNEVLLSDFGIALVAHSSRSQNPSNIAGTVPYMSPEQIQGRPRPASDQYSLGIVIYEWLCGERPFAGSFSELCTQHLFATPPALREKIPTISPAVEELIFTVLAKDPGQRFKNILAFANALEQASELKQSPEALLRTPSVTPQSDVITLSNPSSPVSSQISLQPSKEVSHPEIQTSINRNKATLVSTKPMVESVSTQHRLPRELNGMAGGWSIGTRQAVALLLGSVIFGIVGRFTTYVRLAGLPYSFPVFLGVVILLFFGVTFGPWIGLFSAALGYLVEHAIAGTPIVWNQALGITFIGLVAGFTGLVTKRPSNQLRTIFIAEIVSAIAIVVGIACGSFIGILTSQYTVSESIKIFIVDGSADFVLGLVMLPLLLVIYTQVTKILNLT
jgi:serine/threonine protein kinase